MAQETQCLTPGPLVRRGPERAAACTKNARYGPRILHCLPSGRPRTRSWSKTEALEALGLLQPTVAAVLVVG